MKRILILLFITLSTISVSAQKKMIIHQKNGSNIEVMLKDQPVATYEGTEFVVTTDEATLRFEIVSLEKVTFEDVSTSVEALTILSTDAGASSVYDLNGKLIKTLPEGAQVDASSLPQGTYIVKNKKYSYKIRK